MERNGAEMDERSREHFTMFRCLIHHQCDTERSGAEKEKMSREHFIPINDVILTRSRAGRGKESYFNIVDRKKKFPYHQDKWLKQIFFIIPTLWNRNYYTESSNTKNKEKSIGDKHSSLQQNIVFYRHKKVFNTLKKQEPEPSPINVCQPIPNPPLTTTIQMENLHCLVKK